jgi:hypothetical protein
MKAKSRFTKEQRSKIYKDAAASIGENRTDFGCFAVLWAARELNDLIFSHDVDETNFPEFFLFKEPDASDVWLGTDEFHPDSIAGRLLRYDVLMMCHEMCKD